MDRWLIPRSGEPNLAWRANSNVLTFMTINERMDYTKAVSKKDIQEGIAQLLHPGHPKKLSKVYRKQRCETSNGEIDLIAICRYLAIKLMGLGYGASSHVSAALNDPL